MVMERNPLYDRAKGIGMILVIYGHMFDYGGIPFSIIFSFHMPLFFIISGMLLLPERIHNVKMSTWIRNCIKRYFAPFVFFLVLGCVTRLLYSGCFSTKEVLYQIFYYIGSNELFMGALWFIGALMVAMILMPIIIRLGGAKIITQLFALFILIISSFLFSKLPIVLPFRIKIMSGVLFFVYFGFLFKEKIISSIYNKLIMKCTYFGLPIFLVLSIMNKTINISEPVYNDGLIFLLCAVYGTFFVLLISTYRMPRFIEYLGKNSLIVFSLHAIWIFIFTDVLNRILGTSYAPMVDMPLHYVLLGGVIVIIMTSLSTMLVLPVYNATLKVLKLK